VRAGLIGSLLAVFLLGAFGVLWEWQRADRQRRRAEDGELRALRATYVADMNLGFQAVEAGQRGRAWELLTRYRPEGKSQISDLKLQVQPDLRGWEWRHLWERCESDAVKTLTNCDYLIAGLAVSANGRWLAVSSATNILIWDLVSRQPCGRIPVSAAFPAVDVS
jgi:hypothetical protein